MPLFANFEKSFSHVKAHMSLVLIALSSNEGSGETDFFSKRNKKINVWLLILIKRSVVRFL